MSEKLSTQPYKGTRDFYPEDMRFRNWMFSRIRSAVESFGYEEYGGPLLEPFELYAAKTGDEIVQGQLYSFMDRGDRKVAIRPEMTPTLARIVAAKVQELPKPLRLWCFPNFLRYERPQRGRLREFWQLNVDLLGGDPILADSEVVRVAAAVVEAFWPLSRQQETIPCSVRVNDRRLMNRLLEHVLKMPGNQFSQDSKEILVQVIRLLDGRAKMGSEVFAEKLTQLGFGPPSRNFLESLLSAGSSEDALIQVEAEIGTEETTPLRRVIVMAQSGTRVPIRFSPEIVRGIDYYTGTVFEVFDDSPENNRALFGGGRYDNLIGLFGKNQLSGVGFGMGDVTFENFLRTHQLVPEDLNLPEIDIYLGVLDESAYTFAVQLSQRLKATPLQIGEGNLPTHLRKVVISPEILAPGKHIPKAEALGARYFAAIGKDEMGQKTHLTIKDLRNRTNVSVAL
jgi:histidyl-tRNA synthetase